MKDSPPEHTLVSPYFPSPQPPLEEDQVSSTHDYLTDDAQFVAPSFNTNPWFEDFDVYVTQPQPPSVPDGEEIQESYPSTTGVSESMVTIPLSSSGTLCNTGTNFSDSRLNFVVTTLQDVRRAVLTFSGVVWNAPCVVWIRALVTRAGHMFIRGSEYVAGGITMYNEMCYEGFEFLITLNERIEASIRARSVQAGNEERNMLLIKSLSLNLAQILINTLG